LAGLRFPRGHSRLLVGRPVVFEPCFRQAEVEDLHNAFGVILMLSGFRSRWMMPFSCAASSAMRSAWRMPTRPGADRPRTDHVAKGRTGHELHDDRGSGAGVLDAVHLGDVWMVERGEQAGFERKPLTAVGILGDRRRKNLDGDVTPERVIAGAEHDAHSAGADRFSYFVLSDARTDGERHIQVGDILEHAGRTEGCDTGREHERRCRLSFAQDGVPMRCGYAKRCRLLVVVAAELVA
jgi:hypothetical protein